MKASAFARLCGISPPMVTKYQQAGLLVANGKDVDAGESLKLLAGRLDETKRQAALVQLQAGGQEPQTVEVPASGAEPKKILTGKAAKDHWQALIAEMDYRRRAGELLLVSDVAAQADLAISAMRETFSNAKRDAAKAFCVQFEISPEKEAAVMRFLNDQFETALGRFGVVAGELARPSEKGMVIAGPALIETVPDEVAH